MEDISKYSHSPVHSAVIRRDYVALKRIVSALPRLPKAGEVNTENESVAAELQADVVSAAIDRRGCPWPSDQTFLFLGDGISSDNGTRSLAPGSLIVLSHKEKEITNALEGAGAQPTESEVAHEVALMSQTNMYRPGIDVTQAELNPQLSWRRQERTEMVGSWKAKVYDMLHVMVSVKSRRVPGAMTDEELFAAESEERVVNGAHNVEEYDDVLTPEERMQLDSALRMGNADDIGDAEDRVAFDGQENGVVGGYENVETNGVTKEKKSWFGWNKKGGKNGTEDPDDSKILKKFSKLAPEGSNQKTVDYQRSLSELQQEDSGDLKKGKEKNSKKKKKNGTTGEPKHESEYKKGLRPVLWLTPDFPLKTDELLPLLDILANKGAVGGHSSDSEGRSYKEEVDPFHIPSDYTWVDANEKKRRMKAKKARNKKNKKQTVTRNAESMHQLGDDVEEH
ncbi:hypothetical protein IFM89_017780 [Coptis chinensis]|uniref:Ankyrin repeat domain-containing protein n=1 Tax=Coptis chinensis TaxID=261450 RepID=A0A835M3R1_9MAGN|nr:hypothetical protein IFM89_017780 [Coptis chinensis]